MHYIVLHIYHETSKHPNQKKIITDFFSLSPFFSSWTFSVFDKKLYHDDHVSEDVDVDCLCQWGGFLEQLALTLRVR